MQTKYLVAFVGIAAAILTALQTSIVGGITPTEAWQLAAVIAGVGISIAVPLVRGPWAGALKTGFAVLGAIGATVAPFFVDGALPSPEQWVTVGIAVVNAIGIQVGVSIRTDEVKKAGAILDAGTAVPGVPVNVSSLPTEAATAKAIETLAGDPAAARVVFGNEAPHGSPLMGGA